MFAHLTPATTELLKLAWRGSRASATALGNRQTHVSIGATAGAAGRASRCPAASRSLFVLFSQLDSEMHCFLRIQEILRFRGLKSFDTEYFVKGSFQNLRGQLTKAARENSEISGSQWF